MSKFREGERVRLLVEQHVGGIGIPSGVEGTIVRVSPALRNVYDVKFDAFPATVVGLPEDILEPV
jgi:hypothetical protein